MNSTSGSSPSSGDWEHIGDDEEEEDEEEEEERGNREEEDDEEEEEGDEEEVREEEVREAGHVICVMSCDCHVICRMKRTTNVLESLT